MAQPGPWTAAEDAVVLDASLTAREATARLDRTLAAVQTRRNTLGFKAARREWTADEDRLVLDSSRTLAEIARELRRSIRSVEDRRKKLGGAPGRYRKKGRRWSPGEDVLIIDRSLTTRVVAERLGLDRATVQKRRKELGVGLIADIAVLPEHVESVLRDANQSAIAAARALGVSRNYVQEQRRLRGVDNGLLELKRRQRDYHGRQATTREAATHHGAAWTGPQLELAAREDLTATEVARMLGRTYAAVIGMRQKIRRGDPKARILDGEALY